MIFLANRPETPLPPITFVVLSSYSSLTMQITKLCRRHRRRRLRVRCKQCGAIRASIGARPKRELRLILRRTEPKVTQNSSSSSNKVKGVAVCVAAAAVGCSIIITAVATANLCFFRMHRSYAFTQNSLRVSFSRAFGGFSICWVSPLGLFLNCLLRLLLLLVVTKQCTFLGLLKSLNKTPQISVACCATQLELA